MSAKMEIKSFLSDDYIETDSAQFRNTVGSPLVSVSNYSWACPGVLTFTVTAVTPGISCTATISATQDIDIDHPLLASSPVAFSIIPGNSTTITDYGSYTLSTGVQIGDAFQVGYGYEWDNVDGQWHPAADFGVIAPGESSRMLSARVTNEGSRNWINVYVVASGDGADYVSFRPEGEEWSNESEESLVFLTESGYPVGQITPGGYADFDIRFIMGSNESSSSNPFLVQIWVQITEI